MVSSAPLASQWKTWSVSILIFFLATGFRMRESDSPGEKFDIFMEICMTCSW